jgi:hypothetical protein
VGIPQRGGDVGVTHPLLNHGQVDTPLDHPGGTRMAQHVDDELGVIVHP